MKRFLAGLLCGASVMFVAPSGASKQSWQGAVEVLENRLEHVHDEVQEHNIRLNKLERR